MLSLRELQQQFLSAIAPGPGAPPSPAPGPAGLLDLVEARGALGGAQRLAIYADMYRARLIDVLREDYPKVEARLGHDAFAERAAAYLARFPSRHPSVRHVGRRFADDLAAESDVPTYLAELARLEWARVEAFDAPDAEPLRLADLQAIPPEAWPALRLRLVPSCLVVESAWPVHEIWDAADAGPAPAPPPAAASVRVWREGFQVSHAAMSAVEQPAFRALQRGEPFAGICAALGGDLDEEAAASAAGGLLMRWLEDELLVRLEP